MDSNDQQFNTGLIQKPLSPTDWIFNNYTPLLGGVLNESGNWKQWLPIDEKQNNFGFDRLACVTYSFLNCLEILWKFQGNDERNFSDRFLAKASNTSPAGNTLEAVLIAARNKGLVNESDYPDNANSWLEYYKELTDELLLKAKEFLKEYEIHGEWVRTYKLNDILEAIKQSPLQVTVRYATGEGNLFPSGYYNHAVTCFGYKEGEYWEIFDHYSQTIKRYAWEYEFGAIYKFTLTKKSNIITPMKVIDNTLYNLVDGKGGQALGLDGRLIIDDTSKILATWIARNTNAKGEFEKALVKSIKTVDWNSVPHVNLKGEPV